MNNSYLMFLNAYQGFLTLFSLLVFIPYCALHLHEVRTPHFNFSAGLSIMLTGHLFVRSALWLQRYELIHGQIAPDWIERLPTLNVGNSLFVFGLVCLVRVQGMPTWGSHGWLWFVVVGAILAIVGAL